jgi:hypothetical protein
LLNTLIGDGLLISLTRLAAYGKGILIGRKDSRLKARLLWTKFLRTLKAMRFPLEIRMKEVITEEEMQQKVLQMVESYGSNRLAAAALGIAESALSEMKNGRQSISKTILDHLGYRKTKVTKQVTLNFYLKNNTRQIGARTKKRGIK